MKLKPKDAKIKEVVRITYVIPSSLDRLGVHFRAGERKDCVLVKADAADEKIIVKIREHAEKSKTRCKKVVEIRNN